LVGLDWLKQVVNRVGFECAERVLVEGRGEDDEGLSAESREQFEAVHARHLDIEEEHIDLLRAKIVEGCDCDRGVGCSTDYLNFRKGREQALQTFERQGFIVDEEGA
jgi:hypothetical protein